ncbi:MAG: ABC transporter ATP-binding protein [Polyangiaceae bacterium]|nr:ABC transporter ATP-binding protein [Myxococcales bacterium]MCB9590709.1 ABC transporter ATP-binding protein [Polyangiaceae bacterium]
MTSPSEAFAHIQSLRKSFPGELKPALSNVTLDVMPGVVTGLVGPDGAGKTTLLRLLAGLLVPTSGELSVLGSSPTHDADSLRDSIGYMPQKFGLYEDLSVMENLSLYADLKGLFGEQRRETFERLLEFTDLARFTDRLAGRLSGGMKQKLGLACTLLGTPKVLLLDEPGVGVDPVSRRELWRMVHELIAGGIAVVWSTAYLDEAEACDHVVLLNEGEILFSGAPSELHDRVRSRVFLLTNLEEQPRIALKNSRRDPASMDGVVQGRGVRLIARPDAELRPLEFGVSAHATLTATKPRFEDGFIDLLGGVPSAESELANAVAQHPNDGAIVIRTNQLTKQYGDFKAADGISVAVKRGEVFGLLGPNGAGKSTTFKMLCGLVVPTSGDAEVAGVDLRSSASEARQRLGYMAQKFSLYGNLSVRQNLEFFGGAYALSGKRLKLAIERMVSVFELGPLMKRAAGDLPLGHKQRLALACSLLHGPEILFLDEPTSGVDPLTRREFWTHINGVVERGVTVLVTTHFMDEAEYCDRIGLISRGKMIATGTPDDLKAKATTPEQPDPTMEEAFIALVTEAA